MKKPSFKLSSCIVKEGDILKEVEYKYTIDKSSGLLKIDLTMYNEIDEEEYFIEAMKKLYRLDEFIVYYKNYKIAYDRGLTYRIRMY